MQHHGAAARAGPEPRGWESPRRALQPRVSGLVCPLFFHRAASPRLSRGSSRVCSLGTNPSSYASTCSLRKKSLQRALGGWKASTGAAFPGKPGASRRTCQHLPHPEGLWQRGRPLFRTAGASQAGEGLRKTAGNIQNPQEYPKWVRKNGRCGGRRFRLGLSPAGKTATNLPVPGAEMRPLPFPLPGVIPADAARSQGPSSGVALSPCILKPPGTSKHIPALRLLRRGGGGRPSGSLPPGRGESPAPARDPKAPGQRSGGRL